MSSDAPLRIAVLSRDPNLYSTSRLLEAGEQRGHKMYVIDYVRCYLDINHDCPRVLYQGRDLCFFDAVIPRIGASNTFYGTAVVRQFELMKTYALNGSEAIVNSRDKLRCHQLLAAEGIQLPVTGCAHSTKDVDGLIDVAGGPPVVVKLVEGTQGAGVVLSESRPVAQAVIEAFRVLDANILVQEYIAEAQGADIRCFVVGNEVVASMKRQAGAGDFRSNLHRGGYAEPVEISSEERELAAAAASHLGLRVAGVDLLRSSHGPVVIEVNSSPGLQGIEESTGEDIASMVFEFIEQSFDIELP